MADHGGKTVFTVSTIIILALVAVGAAFPEGFGNIATTALGSVTRLFGWFYLFSVFGFVIFLLVLAFSKYGKIRLGPQDSTPSFSFFSWISMLLAAGFGVGLVFYGMAEPMFHYIEPPYGDVPAQTEASARYAIQYSYFNWGIHQWAAFSVVGLIIAYFQFRKGQAGLVSSVLSSVTAKHPGARRYAPALDIFAVVATVMGVATSLGLGVLQMNGGLNAVFGLPESVLWQFIILFVMFLAYMASTWSGLDKGIKRLSNLNMILCIGLMLWVLFTGPTLAILEDHHPGDRRLPAELHRHEPAHLALQRQHLGEQLDDLLLGLGDRLVALRGHLRGACLPWSHHQGVRVRRAGGAAAAGLPVDRRVRRCGTQHGAER